MGKRAAASLTDRCEERGAIAGTPARGDCMDDDDVVVDDDGDDDDNDDDDDDNDGAPADDGGDAVLCSCATASWRSERLRE